MAADSFRLLYSETARGRLARFLDTHPHFVRMEVAKALNQDFRQAVDYGDLGSAVVAARACSEILNRLGELRESLALQIDLFRLQIDAAGTAEEYTSIRLSALAMGARAQDDHWPIAQVECWLLATECLRRQIIITPAASRPELLITALRDLADLSELISGQPVGEQLREHQARLATLLASVTDAAYRIGWDESALLGLRALLRRTARAAERVIPVGITEEIYPEAQERHEAARRLLRLFQEIDD